MPLHRVHQRRTHVEGVVERAQGANRQLQAQASLPQCARPSTLHLASRRLHAIEREQDGAACGIDRKKRTALDRHSCLRQSRSTQEHTVERNNRSRPQSAGRMRVPFVQWRTVLGPNGRDTVNDLDRMTQHSARVSHPPGSR